MCTWATLSTKQLAGLLEVVNAPRAGMAREQGDVFVHIYTSVNGVKILSRISV
jgi:hypothetical protein